MGHLPECSETYEAGNVIHSDLKSLWSLDTRSRGERVPPRRIIHAAALFWDYVG